MELSLEPRTFQRDEKDQTPGNMDPYLGPRIFQRDIKDQPRFFGRDYETQDIVSYIKSKQLTVIYGKSGVGKTSLFNAQVIPKLELGRLEVLPMARVGIATAAMELTRLDPSSKIYDTTQNLYVLSTLLALNPEMDSHTLLNITIYDFLKDYFPVKKNKKAQVLVFDQFEEFFNVQNLEIKMREVFRMREDFFRQISKALNDIPRLKIVFIIDEGFVSAMDEYKTILPSIIRDRFRLQALQKEDALLAILGPLEYFDYLTDITQKIKTEKEAVSIVDELIEAQFETLDDQRKTIEGEFVDPLLLQIACQSWWYHRNEHNQEIKAKSYVNAAFEDIYEGAINAAVSSVGISEKNVRKWCENKLITAGGTRARVYQGERFTEGLPNKVAEILHNRYLIRSQMSQGPVFYELSYDRMVSVIKNSNSKWEGKKSSLFSLFSKK